MVIKLDMENAYVRLDWNFIKKWFNDLRFYEKWTTQIMLFISSTTFRMIVNVNPCTIFQPQRGIRQGDPFSLYIFIICTKY